jgi:O-acetyl-ADP-ribose deacetylase (regulator of RNase III)
VSRELASASLAGGIALRIIEGNIVKEPVDAIVNAANSMLQHGGGVAAVISWAGGPSVQEESNRVAPVAVGTARATGAGDLPHKHIIHAVGPRWGEGDEEAKLRGAVMSSLEVAHGLGLGSVSLPAISAGIFGFPKERCAEILLATARDFAAGHAETSLREIRLCLFGEEMAELFARKLRDAFPAGG